MKDWISIIRNIFLKINLFPESERTTKLQPFNMSHFCSLIFSENMFSALAHFSEWKIQTMNWSESLEEDAEMKGDNSEQDEDEA